MPQAHRFYRRDLPHFQRESETYFITFRTRHTITLPEPARDIILSACRHWHRTRAHIHGAVVMPDHVHAILTPLEDDQGELHSLEGLLKSIKGTSAKKVNVLLGRTGPLWQAESFDHMLRNVDSAEAKVKYIRQNPVRKGLVEQAEEYRWMWMAREDA
jgi:REP-associated tyrosine transposase